MAQAARSGDFGHFWLFEPNLAIHDALRVAVDGGPATLLADMDDLSPVPDGSVGLAVMIHVLDHLLDPLETLSQLRAKLRPGGGLMIVTHNERSLLRRVLEEYPAMAEIIRMTLAERIAALNDELKALRPSFEGRKD